MHSIERSSPPATVKPATVEPTKKSINELKEELTRVSHHAKTNAVFTGMVLLVVSGVPGRDTGI